MRLIKPLTAFVLMFSLVTIGWHSLEPTPTVIRFAAPQTLDVAMDVSSQSVVRDSYTVTDPPPPVRAQLPTVTPDPGSAQALALELVTARGWSTDEFNCLVALWNRESGWNVNAHNASSGAHGIPQALPGDKMGVGWETDATVQVTWGINYISSRYSTPCGAWQHSEANGWY